MDHTRKTLSEPPTVANGTSDGLRQDYLVHDSTMLKQLNPKGIYT